MEELLKNLQKLDNEPIKNKIESNFKEHLSNYKFVNKNELRKGKYVKYFNLNLDQIRSGLITGIFKKGKSIKCIYMRDLSYKYTWKIDPNKYHFYEYSRNYSNGLRDWLEKIINQSENKLD